MIVVVGGLQGTGKSTLAAALGRRLGAFVVARDDIEASLWRSGVTAEQGSRRAADDLLLTFAEQAQANGADLVLDSVFGAAAQRRAVADLSERCGARLRFIECTCSDEELHRARIDGRDRGIDGWYELTWADVEETRARCEPWTEERLVIDAIHPLDANVDLALAHLARG